MKNFIQPGKSLTFTAGGTITSGTALLVQNLVVVPAVSVSSGVDYEGYIEGVFTLAKTAGAAWSTGQVLYYDTGTSSFTTAASATARRAGIAAAAAQSADTTGAVRLVNIGAAVNVA